MLRPVFGQEVDGVVCRCRFPIYVYFQVGLVSDCYEVQEVYTVIVFVRGIEMEVWVDLIYIVVNCLRQRFPTFSTRGVLFRINFYGGAP